jgi:purine-binding chemotaxis protein CheW
MADLLLIVTLGGRRVAIDAAEVESVVEMEGLVPIPRGAPHIAGLTALRSRVLTVIDCHKSLGIPECETECRDAIVVVRDGHPYALRVEAVEDVVEASADPAPLPARLDGGWRRAGRAMVEADGRLLLLLDTASLIAGPDLAEAA